MLFPNERLRVQDKDIYDSVQIFLEEKGIVRTVPLCMVCKGARNHEDDKRAFSVIVRITEHEAVNAFAKHETHHQHSNDKHTPYLKFCKWSERRKKQKLEEKTLNNNPFIINFDMKEAITRKIYDQKMW